MKKLINMVICYFKRNHTAERLKKNGGKFHEFYHINGGGRSCVCPFCGKSLILRGK